MKLPKARKFLILLILLPCQVLFAQSEIDPGFNKMLMKKYAQAFPVINPEEAQALIGNGSTIFLDTREMEEYSVSHLPGAIHVGYKKVDWEKIETLDKTRKVIVYCAVGIRSEDIGRQLQKRGFTDVHNLYGGIFLWADQQRPMLDETEQPTSVVHGYNWWWGRWVKKAQVVYQ